MGQKANPIGLRVGVIRGWDSNWYENKSYALKLKEDKKLRDFDEQKKRLNLLETQLKIIQLNKKKKDAKKRN